MALGRKTGGRSRGTPNRKTREQQEHVRKTGVTPLEFMLNLMRTELPEDASSMEKASMRSLQFEAAKAAAPYVHPKLSNVEMSGKDGKPLAVVLHSSDEKL
jgi:hypothetical protein